MTNVLVASMKNDDLLLLVTEILNFWNVITPIFISCAEELFFRGFVLRELLFNYVWQPIRASLIVSFLFGVLHLLNVNSYATWGYAIVQSICAFAISFNLCAIFIETKSLLWCVLIHALINITSIGLEYCANGQQLSLSNFESIIFLSVSSIYLISGIKMLNNKMVEGK
jgi:membrane protease YdiL (CAAX protease family)